MQTIPWEQAQRSRAVYTYLLLAPLLALPCSNTIQTISYSIIDFSHRTPPGVNILASVIPLIVYLPVFLKTRSSESLFVRTHARQGVVLIVLRTLSWMAFLSSNNYGYLALNAFLWLVGSQVGRSQVNKGRSWLGNLRVIIEPAPVKIMKLPVGAQRQALVAAALEVAKAGHTPMHREEVVQILLEDFRAGDPNARRRAIEGLETLGEVESF